MPRHPLPRFLLLAFCFVIVTDSAVAQVAKNQQSAYQYHVVGNSQNVETKAGGGLLLMGGGTDVDEAFRWMIEKSGGGDFVIIRASGGDAYNPYIARLGKLDSVETIIFKSRAASTDEFVIEKIRNAEALFIAGGDQLNYVYFWKGSPVEDAIHHLARRNVPIGGTSAGLAILGEYLFPARKDTIRSEAALADPFHEALILDRDFLTLPNLRGVITDSHFAERDRMGRLLAFLARLLKDGWAKEARAIAVDRETAVAVEPTGAAKVLGKYAAYFLRADASPALCEPGKPLTFENVAVLKVTSQDRFDASFDVSFDLGKWVGGGEAYRVSVRRGVLMSSRADGKIY